jgi:DNA-directed RNA polymerase beta subunit
VGTTYYQRLKHMVNDKIRARARGRIHIKTHQTIEGRKDEGGLKCGEMEKDTFLSYGSSAVIRERLFFSSDPAYLHVCQTCQYNSIYSEEMDRAYCNFCDTWDTSLKVFLPYGFKSFIQDLQSVGIAMKLKVVAANTPALETAS